MDFISDCTKGDLEDAKRLYNKYCDINLAFFHASRKGRLEIVKWLYSLGGLNIEKMNFETACWNGDLEEAKRLYTKDCDINIVFYRACKYGHLEVAQWLYSLGISDIERNIHGLFRQACENGHLELSKWLYSLRRGADVHFNEEEAFFLASRYGQLETVQWLCSLGVVDIHADNDHAFRTALFYRHLKVAEWLYSLGGVNIHTENDEAFRYACIFDRFKIAQWLYFLDPVILGKKRIKFLKFLNNHRNSIHTLLMECKALEKIDPNLLKVICDYI